MPITIPKKGLISGIRQSVALSRPKAAAVARRIPPHANSASLAVSAPSASPAGLHHTPSRGGVRLLRLQRSRRGHTVARTRSQRARPVRRRRRGPRLRHALDLLRRPEVLTVSLNESGAFLYPGTGFHRRVRPGRRYVPLTRTTITLRSYTRPTRCSRRSRTLAAPTSSSSRPAATRHLLDPLTHRRCTSSMYESSCVSSAVSPISNTKTNHRVGVGAYTCTPRAWTLDWVFRCDVAAPDCGPDDGARGERRSWSCRYCDITRSAARVRRPLAALPRGGRNQQTHG
jgi:hypothetical protein